jgi:DNA-binding response OmpR family regulator
VVLVVEDDQAVREVLRDALAADYDVVTAADGPTALQLFRRRPADGVLLDVRLPGLSGLDVLRRMKAVEPRTGVILVTAVGEVATVVEGMKAGAADYMTKPFDLGRLLAAVEGVVQRRTASGDLFLVADDAGPLAAAHVIVERAGPTAISLSSRAALKGLSGRRPGLLVLESPADRGGAIDLVRRLQSRYEACPLLVMVADRPAAVRLRRAKLLPRTAIVAGPHHIDVILERIADGLAAGGTRVEMPPLGLTVVTAVEHVSRHYREQLRAEDVARAVHVTPEQLGRHFRESLGITAKAFITRFRLGVACRMLIDADEKLDHIAQVTGFVDGSHLSRTFVRELRMRPGQYRRRLEQAA